MQEVEVANQALALIGQDPITALDDGTTVANRVKLFFATERDATLRDHPWNFSITRKALAVNATAPISGFTYGFRRDPDDLRVLSVNEDRDLVWQVEGRDIVMSESVCIVKFISRITNPDLWDAEFVSAFVLRLASKFALAISHQAGLSREMLTLYMAWKEDAQSVDGQEQGVQESLAPIDLIDVRNTV